MSHVTEMSGSAPEMAGASGTAEQATAPPSAAERMARHRERKKGGLRSVPLEVRKSEIAGAIGKNNSAQSLFWKSFANCNSRCVISAV